MSPRAEHLAAVPDPDSEGAKWPEDEPVPLSDAEREQVRLGVLELLFVVPDRGAAALDELYRDIWPEQQGDRPLVGSEAQVLYDACLHHGSRAAVRYRHDITAAATVLRTYARE